MKVRSTYYTGAVFRLYPQIPPVWIDGYRRKRSNRAVRMNRTILVALALLLTATAATFAANPLIGTWKLNEGKSKFAPGATKNITVTYAPAKGDMVRCTVDGGIRMVSPSTGLGWGNSMANRTELKGAHPSTR
jgi:hypothetical protein